jgi:hypothetical protein
MASITDAVLCAAVATLFWSGLGLTITRRLVPGALALPVAPVVGWVVHSAIVLPVFFFVPFSATTIATVAAIVLVVGIFASLTGNYPEEPGSQAGVPAWAYAAAALLAMAPAAAIMPKAVGDAVFLADPIFDHAKVALIDDMARLGLPPGRGIEVDLVPAQVTRLGGAQSVPEDQEDHGGVPLPVAVGLGRVDQGLDLARRQVLPGAKLGVRSPLGATVRFTSVGATSLRLDFAMETGLPRIATVRSFGKQPTVCKPQNVGESNCRGSVGDCRRASRVT